jgi:hypothetical protein
MFDAQPKPQRRYFLRFGAVDYRALVYLNGKQVGEHEVASRRSRWRSFQAYPG